MVIPGPFLRGIFGCFIFSTAAVAQVATPAYSPAPQASGLAKVVAITCSTPNSTIHYTLNGLDPTLSDPTYSSPVAVNETGTLKAKAWTASASSAVAAGGYNITGYAAAGANFAFSLRLDGTVNSWGGIATSGTIYDGRLGRSASAATEIPGAVAGLNGSGSLGNIAFIAAGTSNAIVLTTTGTVYSWGANDRLQLGNNTSVASSSVPVQVVSSYGSLNNVSQIAAGSRFHLALIGSGSEAGKIYGWGKNGGYQLALLNTTDRTVAATVKTDTAGTEFTGATAIAAGADHGMALKGGNVWVWGNNAYNQAGNNFTDPKQKPGQKANLGNIVSIYSGNNHCFAINSSGQLYVWGQNNKGQVGNGSTTPSVNAPVTPVGLTSGVVMAEGGVAHSLALKGGNVYSWGDNTYGQLGDGTTTPRTSPVLVLKADGTPLSNIVTITAGDNFSMAVAADGTIYSWGQNADRQMAFSYPTTTNFAVAYGVNGASLLTLGLNGYGNGISSLLLGGSQFIASSGSGLGTHSASTSYDFSQGNLPTSFTTVAYGTTFVQTYSWGKVSTIFSMGYKQLVISQSITNTSGSTIKRWITTPFHLITPFSATLDTAANPIPPNLDDPQVNVLDYGSGKVAYCGIDVMKPTMGGFVNTGDPYNWDLVYEVGQNPNSPNNFAYDDLPNLGIRTTTFRIKFGSSSDTKLSLGKEVFSAYAAAYPYQLAWNNKGALGVDYIAGSTPTPQNPRKYLNGQTIDVTTPAGRADFAIKLLNRADGDLVNLAKIHAQGIMIWDVEGQELPQPLTYIGDPRICEILAPELSTLVTYNGTSMKVVDAFFKKFTDAGYQVGITLRPSLLNQNGVWVGNLTPVSYNPSSNLSQDEVGVRGLSDQQTADLLVAKINYAKNRWGCKLFYCDSDWLPTAKIFRLVNQAVPDVIVFPENSFAGHYSASAPLTHLSSHPSTPGPSNVLYGYDDVGWQKGQTELLSYYPSAFSLEYTADGQIAGTQNFDSVALRAAVLSGKCILMGRIWFNDPALDAIKAAYGY